MIKLKYFVTDNPSLGLPVPVLKFRVSELLTIMPGK